MTARAERASGVLGTTFGVGVVVALLALSSHVLLNLWLRSSVEAVAFDAATRVALAPDGGEQEAIAAETEQARRSLGRYGDRVRFEWEADGTAGNVVLRVTAPELRLLPRLASWTPEGLDRRIVVRRERTTRRSP